VLPEFDSMATSFETRQTQILERSALEEVKTEYAKHFEAVAKPPRLLVGTEVPSLTGQGKEKLRDSADARDWQEAVKQLLLEEVTSRVEKRKDGMRDVFAVVHSSIDLFRNNTDLIPGTVEFDKDLANAVAAQVKDYELLANGKLIGFSVPVQPIINAVRAQLAAQKAATPPAAAAPPQQAAPQARDALGRWDGPQAGIQSKAGQSAAAGTDDAGGVMAAFYRQNGLQI